MPKNRLKHLNKRASSAKFKADEIMQKLAVQPGAVIADVGAGGGFYTLSFAEAVAEKGKVFAVDTNPDNLSYIQTSAMEKQLENVHTFITPEEQLALPDEKFDLIFMRNMFHHLPEPHAYFTSIAKFLKQKGRVAVIDYKKTKGFSLSFSQLHRHYSDPALIAEVMQSNGLALAQSFDFLPKQSFQIFTKA